MTPLPMDALAWEGQTMLDRAGEKIGTIEEIYLVEDTGRPEWALVKLGRLKSHTTLVPITNANPVEKGVKIAYAKDRVDEAPPIDAGAEPDEQQVNALYRHYGIRAGDASAGAAPMSGNGASAASQQQSREVLNGSADLRDEPIGDLVKQVSEETKTLVSQEITLAKAEITDKAKEIGVGAGIFGGAGYLAALATLAFMLCLIFALATFMPAWLAALMVTIVFLAGAVALAMIAKKRIKKAGPPVPEETIESVKQTIETVKEEAKWGLGQTR